MIAIPTAVPTANNCCMSQLESPLSNPLKPAEFTALSAKTTVAIAPQRPPQP